MHLQNKGDFKKNYTFSTRQKWSNERTAAKTLKKEDKLTLTEEIDHRSGAKLISKTIEGCSIEW